MQLRRAGLSALFVTAAALVAGPAYAQMTMSAGSPQNYAVSARPGDIWTAGGLLFAPRYLAAGGGEIGIGPALILGATPFAPASPYAAELGGDYAIADGTEIGAMLGPVTLIGIRSQLFANDYGAIGWGLHYRADMYPWGLGPTGKTPPQGFFRGLTAAPLIGGLAMAQGAELHFDFEQELGPLNLYLSPKIAAMSIGLKPGLGLGLDLDLGRIVLGYNLLGQVNVTPASTFYNTGLQLEHGLGGRFVVNDNVYVQANWYDLPDDDLNNSEQGVLVGVGYQWGNVAPAQSVLGGGSSMRMSH